MKKFWVTTFILVAIVALISVFSFTPPNQLSKGFPFTFGRTISDENAIYSTILKELFDKGDVKFLIISNHTNWRNETPANLNYEFDLTVNYVVINGEDYDHRVLLDEEGPKDENRKPPISNLINKYRNSVFVGLSNIEFNENKMTASTYVESPGQGRMIYLEKEQGFWKVKKISDLWISQLQFRGISREK